MKTPPVALAIISLFLGACAANDPAHPSQKAAVASGESEPSQQPPRVGMTKAEVLALYGDPTSKIYGSKGEVWKYWFNRAASIWIGTHARIAIIAFDEKGRVKDYVFNDD